jgi:hypothetical protein
MLAPLDVELVVLAEQPERTDLVRELKPDPANRAGRPRRGRR